MDVFPASDNPEEDASRPMDDTEWREQFLSLEPRASSVFLRRRGVEELDHGLREQSMRMGINTPNAAKFNLVKLQRAHGGYLGTQRR